MISRDQIPFEPTQAELKETEFACRARVNLTPGGFALGQDMLTQLVTPQGCNRHRQQQALNAVGVLQARVRHIKPTRLVIAETLFNGYALSILAQARSASRLLRNHGDEFRRIFLVAFGPAYRQVGEQRPGLCQKDVLIMASPTLVYSRESEIRMDRLVRILAEEVSHLRAMDQQAIEDAQHASQLRNILATLALGVMTAAIWLPAWTFGYYWFCRAQTVLREKAAEPGRVVPRDLHS